MRWLAPLLLSPGLGCAVHAGVAPAAAWSIDQVAAPVAEPGVGESVRAAMVAALAARNALGGPDLRVEVVSAEWRPSRRSGATLLYDARLVVRAHAGGETREASAATSHADPGAGATPELRARAFEALARRVASDLVTWAVSR